MINEQHDDNVRMETVKETGRFRGGRADIQDDTGMADKRRKSDIGRTQRWRKE